MKILNPNSANFTFIGFIAKTPRQSRGHNDTVFVSFDLAINKGRNRPTEYLPIIFFGPRAGEFAERAVAGGYLQVSGEVRQSFNNEGQPRWATCDPYRVDGEEVEQKVLSLVATEATFLEVQRRAADGEDSYIGGETMLGAALAAATSEDAPTKSRKRAKRGASTTNNQEEI
jgi:hypothetical protein